jgi:hypothetical protein
MHGTSVEFAGNKTGKIFYLLVFQIACYRTLRHRGNRNHTQQDSQSLGMTSRKYDVSEDLSQ